jgi:hypothetical protein
MPHTYKFMDAEHTIVGRGDGKSFAWPPGTNVANINGRIAEEYRLEGSPKISPYTESKPVAATKPKQQTKPPGTVASAEAVLAALEQDRRQLVSARAADDAEMAKHAYQSHVLHELGASRSLDEIGKRAIERDQRLRELDCAIFEARDRCRLAQESEQRATNQQRAEEAHKLVCELGEVFPYLDRKLAEAANALIAIDDGIAKLHQAGFQFPSDSQLRLNICAIIETWAMRLPKHFHNQLRDGVRFLAPHERKTGVQYWAQIQASIDNQITQRLDKTEQSKKERAA